MNHTFEISLFWLITLTLFVVGAGIAIDRYYRNRKLPWEIWETYTFFTDPVLKLEGWVDEHGVVDMSWFTGEFENKPDYAGRIPHGTKIRVILKGTPMTGYTAVYDQAALIELAKQNQLPVKV